MRNPPRDPPKKRTTNEFLVPSFFLPVFGSQTALENHEKITAHFGFDTNLAS